MEPGEHQRESDAGHSAQENVFSRRVRAGKQTCFFDVKATRSVKDFYIVITESRKVAEEKYEKHKIFLYKEDFTRFIDALGETSQFVERELLERAPTSS